MPSYRAYQQAPSPQLPDGVFSRARELIKAQLQTPGTAFFNYVRTWSFMDGLEIDNINPTEWTLDLFPLFRMEVIGTEAYWQNQVTQTTDMVYVLTFVLEGTDQRRMMNFFEAAFGRIYPCDPELAFYKSLKQFGVMSYTIALLGITQERYQDQPAQLAQARLTFKQEFRTRY